MSLSSLLQRRIITQRYLLPVLLLQVDIQGAEKLMFYGAQETIK